jgi:hypothetical protein
MRKMIFLAIALLATGICATTDVQVSGVIGHASVSAAAPDSSALLAHLLRRRRGGYSGQSAPAAAPAPAAEQPAPKPA